MRSYFEAFIETNTLVQSDFDFDGWFKNYNFFRFKIACVCYCPAVVKGQLRLPYNSTNVRQSVIKSLPYINSPQLKFIKHHTSTGLQLSWNWSRMSSREMFLIQWLLIIIIFHVEIVTFSALIVYIISFHPISIQWSINLRAIWLLMVVPWNRIGERNLLKVNKNIYFFMCPDYE